MTRLDSLDSALGDSLVSDSLSGDSLVSDSPPLASRPRLPSGDNLFGEGLFGDSIGSALDGPQTSIDRLDSMFGDGPPGYRANLGSPPLGIAFPDGDLSPAASPLPRMESPLDVSPHPCRSLNFPLCLASAFDVSPVADPVCSPRRRLWAGRCADRGERPATKRRRVDSIL
jgi:hypothetical protein